MPFVVLSLAVFGWLVLLTAVNCWGAAGGASSFDGGAGFFGSLSIATNCVAGRDADAMGESRKALERVGWSGGGGARGGEWVGSMTMGTAGRDGAATA